MRLMEIRPVRKRHYRQNYVATILVGQNFIELTEKQVSVLNDLMLLHNLADIARHRNVGYQSIKNYVKILCDKTGMDSAQELREFVMENSEAFSDVVPGIHK